MPQKDQQDDCPTADAAILHAPPGLNTPPATPPYSNAQTLTVDLGQGPNALTLGVQNLSDPAAAVLRAPLTVPANLDITFNITSANGNFNHPTRSVLSDGPCEIRMYIKLFQSYVYWLESRGRPPQWARITVAFALTAAALLNAVAALMLVQAVGGPRLGDWMADHSWVIWVAAVGFAFLHWLLGRRIPPADTGTPVPVTRVWWTYYMVLTLVLWVVASACTLVQMT